MNALFMHSVLLADWWTSMMSDLDPSKRFALITVMFGCAMGVICTIVVFVSSTINSIHRRRVEADMKREMIERGMSAEDIATIIESASPPEDGTQRWIASCGKQKKCLGPRSAAILSSHNSPAGMNPADRWEFLIGPVLSGLSALGAILCPQLSGFRGFHRWACRSGK